MRTPTPAPVAIPMPVFVAMLHARQERTRVEQAQNAQHNDGRTGFIVRY